MEYGENDVDTEEEEEEEQQQEIDVPNTRP